MTKGKTIFTIGYAGLPIENYILLLGNYNINAIIDVRSQPYSQYHNQYNKEILGNTLKRRDIYYRNYATEFGARQPDKKYYCNEGYLDFSKYIASQTFLSGVNKILNSVEKGYRLCLMCAEKNPISCHRTILVSRVLHERGLEVRHILHDGSSITQGDVESQLLELYFPKRDQCSLFESNKMSNEEYITQAYEKQNQMIGYREGDE